MTTAARTRRLPSLSIYFVLAFLISWGAIFLAVGTQGFPVTEEQLPALIVAMLLGPSGAGVIAALTTDGKAGLRELFSGFLRWRVGFAWYGLAILIAPLSTLLVLLALSPTSLGLSSALTAATDKTGLFLMWIPAALLVGIFEELGWTGFAIPQMRRRYSVFVTGLLVGLLWGAWHLLVNLENDTFAGALPFGLLLVRLFSWLPAYRLLMVWVFDRTDSKLVTTVMHISLVATTGILDPVAEGEALLVFLLGKALVFWLVVAVVFLRRPGTNELATHHSG